MRTFKETMMDYESNFEYPSTLIELNTVLASADLQNYLDDRKALLIDYREARFAIEDDPAGVSFAVRSAIVIAERLTTAQERSDIMGIVSRRRIDGIDYEVVAYSFTYGSYGFDGEPDQPALSALVDDDIPLGHILWVSGSYHERFEYILKPVESYY